jgi:hypothetical protein
MLIDAVEQATVAVDLPSVPPPTATFPAPKASK